jgi:hypothetical protein
LTPRPRPHFSWHGGLKPEQPSCSIAGFRWKDALLDASAGASRKSCATISLRESSVHRDPLMTRRSSRATPAAARAERSVEQLEVRAMLSAVFTSTLKFAPPNIAGESVLPIAKNLSGGSSSPFGLTPQQIRRAYGIDNIVFQSSTGAIAGAGAGQTIAIVDAYDDPSIVADLHAFDQAFGLADPKLTVVKQSSNIGNAKDHGGAEEICLDVEWAHAIAPAANIILFEANSFLVSDMFAMIDMARNTLGVSVISMSFGMSEFSGETSMDSHFHTPAGHAGITFVAATGDDGAPASYPAFSPNVLAVGGTTLSVDTLGNYLGETAWSGSGGGVSKYESKPAYQSGINRSQRSGPDVAFDADPATGVAVYDSDDFGSSAGWCPGRIGGTSMAAPCWAGLIAIADEGRKLANQANLADTQAMQALYNIKYDGKAALAYHDITSGNNGFPAGVGYDLATGLGTPIAPSVISALGRNLAAPVLVSPSGGANVPALTQPLLKWNAVAGAGGYLLSIFDQDSGRYVLQSHDLGYIAPAANQVSFSPPISLFVPAPGDHYTWYIQPYTDLRFATTSAHADFNISELDAPTPLSPVAGDTVLTATPTLNWSSVAQATSYAVTVVDQAAPGTIVASATVAGTSWKLTSHLLRSHSYTWSVHAIVPYGGKNFAGPDASDSLAVASRLAPEIDAIPSAITTPENVPIALSGIHISDLDAGGNPISVSFQIGSGILSAASDPTVSATGSGTDTVTLTGSDVAIDAYLGANNLVYVPVSETGGGDLSTSLSVTVTDDNVPSGQSSLTAGPIVVNVTVKAVNNPPQITAVPSPISIDEDTSFAISGIQLADPDVASGQLTVTLTVSHGTLTAGALAGITAAGSPASLSLSGTLANLNTYLAGSNVTYTPLADYNGSDGLSILVSDNGNTGLGGAMTDGPAIVAISIAAINDPPLITFVPGSIPGFKNITIQTGGIHVADVDGGSGLETVTLTVAQGTLSANSSATVSASNISAQSLTLVGTISDLNTYLSGSAISYLPPADFVGTDQLSISVSDGGNTGAGGVLTAGPSIVQIQVNDVLPDQVIVSNGLLLVSADDGSNAIAVTRGTSNVTVTIGALTKIVSVKSVQRVVVLARGGDDSISISGLAVPVLVDGGDGLDSVRVTGLSTSNAFALSGSSLFVNAIEDSVTGVETLKIIGQGSADTLTVPAGGLSGFAVAYNGGAGVNTLIGPDLAAQASNQWIVSGHNAGTLDTQFDDGMGNITQSPLLTFFSVQRLTGGSGVDAWLFKSGGSIDSKLDGAGGANSLVYANPIADVVNLQTGAATSTAGVKNITAFTGGSTSGNKLIGPNGANLWTIDGTNSGSVSGVAFNNFQNVAGGTLADTFQLVAAGHLTGKLDGGTGANTLIGPDQDNVWRIIAKNSGRLNNMAFANVGNLTGGSGDDDFILSAGMGIGGKLDGGGGLHNALDYSHYTTAVIVNLANGAATNIFAGASGGVSNIQIVLGGSGGNTLTGGGQSTVLVGGMGHDTLTGGTGRNILIGGAGPDTLTGGLDEDLLASGTTGFSSSLTALDALFDYWNGADDFATRVGNLRAGNILGAPVLNSTSILDDASTDTLTGSAGLDWFFAKLTAPAVDTITDLDLARGEQLN